MSHIDYVNLSRFDLNLLLAFDALASEKSVTRAAARLGIGQPAMSHALARLRTLFDDELFVRSADGMIPTPKCLLLVDPVRLTLSSAQQVLLQEQQFDPAQAVRTFHLGMPDSIEVVLLPRLVARMQLEAPGVTIRAWSTDRFHVLDQLDSGDLHLAVGQFEQGGMHHKRRGLYGANYLCLYDPQQVRFDSEALSLEQYLSVPHVLLGSVTSKVHGVVDDALAALGLRRTVGVTTAHFIAVPHLLRQAALISTCVQPAAQMFADSFGLRTSPVPVSLPDVHVAMLWHASYDKDPGHRWLRQLVASVMPVA